MIDAMTRRGVAILAFVDAGLCLAAGASYLHVSPTDAPVAFLATCAVLGAGALVAAGLWQYRDARELPVGVTALLAAGFAGASGLGVSFAQLAHDARLEPIVERAVLHGLGAVGGTVLFISASIVIVRNGRKASVLE
jgi:hypothetical protein